MSRAPQAFMSYVNKDDEDENGRITKFREHLSRAVGMRKGEDFEIFQDKKDIAWGQPWQELINDSLDAADILIPIITPRFFNSKACRKELERFLKREEELGRNDLILPVYYMSCPVLQDKAKQEHDRLAQIIAARQYADWRQLHVEEFTSSPVRKALAKMAEQLMAALERSEVEAARAESVRKADAAEKTPPPQQAKKGSKEPTSSSNTFQSKGGEQNIAQGYGAIGTQINNYYNTPPTKSKPQPVPTAKTEPPTVVVDAIHRGDYVTITEAINAVKAGTRILVRPGLYREGIVMDKPVEIVGDGERDKIVIEASGKHKTNMGRLANLTLRQAGGGEWYTVDIAHGRLKIEDCDISSQSRSCVAIYSSAAPCLRRNRIHDGQTGGIVVYENGKGILEDNEIFANVLSGMTIKTGGSPTLSRNRITQNGNWGICVYGGGGGIFENNDLRDNAGGAWNIERGCEARVQRRGNIE